MNATGDYVEIRQRICGLYGLQENAFDETRRIKPAPQARHLCRHLMVARGHDYSTIARAMNVNHTTVIRSCRLPREEIEGILLQHVGIARRADVKKQAASILLDIKATLADKPTERELYDRARFIYASAPEDQRPSVWEEACRFLYPHSWERQVVQPPRLA
jgi:hypothetical protein